MVRPMVSGMICLRGWRPGDEAAFTPRPGQVNEHDWAAGPPDGEVFTLYRWGGEVVGVAGFLPGDGATWEAWSIMASLRPREYLWCRRLADRAIRLARHRGAAAVKAYVRLPPEHRFLRRIGFQPAAGFRGEHRAMIRAV